MRLEMLIIAAMKAEEDDEKARQPAQPVEA
jgi:hypothetical protein